jgi:hypothetical protein
MDEIVYRWRRDDGLTLEVLRLHRVGDGYRAQSWCVSADTQPFAVDYTWDLDRAWRTRTVAVRMHGPVTRTLSIERRSDVSWSIDGSPRADLNGCEEVDLSITPFCNTLALLRFGPPPGVPAS